ncbi:MAG: peptidylprolyl isomerase [Bacteroidota bacterium]|nr:peptidylprolyl isomerase [Bacteroidota bacterium]
MKTFLYFLLAFSLVLFVNCEKDEPEPNPPAPPAPVTKYETIKITTEYGDIFIWLYDKTPKHKENFIKLTTEKYFDSIIFHRVINDFVIQTGDPTGTGTGGPGYRIPAEFDTSLKHVYGAVGAARLSDNVNPDRESSGSQFYIVENTDGTSFLDTKYTVFGIVFSGLDAVSEIADVKTNTKDKPIDDVHMLKVQIVEYSKKELKDLYDFEMPE